MLFGVAFDAVSRREAALRAQWEAPPLGSCEAHSDAAELFGGIIGVVSTALCWNRADPARVVSAVPKVCVNSRGEDVIFFDGVFFEPSLKGIFFVS